MMRQRTLRSRSRQLSSIILTLFLSHVHLFDRPRAITMLDLWRSEEMQRIRVSERSPSTNPLSHTEAADEATDVEV